MTVRAKRPCAHPGCREYALMDTTVRNIGKKLRKR